LQNPKTDVVFVRENDCAFPTPTPPPNPIPSVPPPPQPPPHNAADILKATILTKGLVPGGFKVLRLDKAHYNNNANSSVNVSIDIYNNNNVVKHLTSFTVPGVQSHDFSVQWDGTDRDDNAVPDGSYTLAATEGSPRGLYTFSTVCSGYFGQKNMMTNGQSMYPKQFDAQSARHVYDRHFAFPPYISPDMYFIMNFLYDHPRMDFKDFRKAIKDSKTGKGTLFPFSWSTDTLREAIRSVSNMRNEDDYCELNINNAGINVGGFRVKGYREEGKKEKANITTIVDKNDYRVITTGFPDGGDDDVVDDAAIIPAPYYYGKVVEVLAQNGANLNHNQFENRLDAVLNKDKRF